MEVGYLYFVYKKKCGYIVEPKSNTLFPSWRFPGKPRS